MSDDTPTTQRDSERAVAEAKQRLDRAVEHYTSAQFGTEQQQAAAPVELHQAAVGLWWQMRPHIRDDGTVWADLADYDVVERDYVWRGTHQQIHKRVTITGLRDIASWINRQEPVLAASTGPRASQHRQVRWVTVPLPTGGALAAAKILTERFHEFGWDAAVDHDTPGDEPEPKHLTGLLRRRGQQDAAKQLPERFKQQPAGGVDES